MHPTLMTPEAVAYEHEARVERLRDSFGRSRRNRRLRAAAVADAAARSQITTPAPTPATTPTRAASEAERDLVGAPR